MRSPLDTQQILAMIRFGIVGVGQNLISYAVLMALVALGLKAWQAFAIIYPLAVLATFVANRNWVFVGRRNRPDQFARYIATYAAGYPISLLLSHTLVGAGFAQWSAALITILVLAGGIYLSLNLWVFRK